MVSKALLLAVVFRSISLLLPQTFFQPDEYYQALEPAHHLVFGYGHLTWEWKDLPGYDPPNVGAQSWWSSVVVGGRMRGWLWPSVFAATYKLLKLARLDDTVLLVWLPRIVGVVIAALTDHTTYRLSSKLLGPGSSAGALFLSLTSLFNAHLLPRSLSTSPETLLTTLALLYFPLPGSAPVQSILVGDEGVMVSKDMQEVRATNIEKQAKALQPGDGEAMRLKNAGELDHSMLDRIDQEPQHRDSLELSVIFAALAVCIRPTMLPFWAYMGADLIWRTSNDYGVVVAWSTASRATIFLLNALIANMWLDYLIAGRLMVPTLTFIHRNIITQLSAFYGSTHWAYHILQSLPIMLFPIWFWWIKGFLSCLLPRSIVLGLCGDLDRPTSMQILARGLTFGIAVLSLSPHSEWRFLHPFLPALMLYALPPMFKAFTAGIMGCWYPSQSIRSYTRLPKSAFYLCLWAPLLPWLYLNLFHGRAQVEVMSVLRRGEVGNVTSLVALMPCHSTPWQSHLHRNIDAWFLTCEPSLDPADVLPTEQDLFYSSPAAYIRNTFPHRLDRVLNSSASEKPLPSHLMLFGDLLEAGAEGVNELSVSDALHSRGYEQVWRMWNGFDMLQDEPKRRGDVEIWRRPEGL